MIINTCQILPFFKISWTHACKMTHFSWFREFSPPIENIPLFRENGYERGIRFGREWIGRVPYSIKSRYAVSLYG